jgi:RES domain-containing protein
LEILVHGDLASLSSDYVAIPVEMPDRFPRQIVDVAGLPPDWQLPLDAYCQALGNAWYSANKTFALDVPSAVVPLERNLVVNVLHTDFASLDVSHYGYPLEFDTRLLRILKLP